MMSTIKCCKCGEYFKRGGLDDSSDFNDEYRFVAVLDSEDRVTNNWWDLCPTCMNQFFHMMQAFTSGCLDDILKGGLSYIRIASTIWQSIVKGINDGVSSMDTETLKKELNAIYGRPTDGKRIYKELEK